MRFISVCLLIFSLLFLPQTPVFAHTEYQFPQATEGQINEALTKTVPLRFLPSHPLYFLITIKENFERFFQPSSVEKANFDLVLSDKRLKEAYLLLQKNDVKNSSRSLKRYGQRLEKMISQLEKAKSKNQDISPQVQVVAEEFRHHETLFFATLRKWQDFKEGYSFDENFEMAISSFTKAVITIDNIKPGLKDRFKTVTSQ